MSDESYELVMPFVVCKTQGGPFDDASFVAGWRLGSLDVELKTRTALDLDQYPNRMVKSEELPQVNLIAMKYDLIVNHLDDDDLDSEWIEVSFTKSKDDI